MAKRTRSRTAASPPAETTAPGDEPEGLVPEARDPAGSLEDEIRLRAYYRYLEREAEAEAGEREAEAGDELSDWLEAEADVLGRHATGADADEKVSEGR